MSHSPTRRSVLCGLFLALCVSSASWADGPNPAHNDDMSDLSAIALAFLYLVIFLFYVMSLSVLSGGLAA